MRKIIHALTSLILICTIVSSCKVYRQNILFESEDFSKYKTLTPSSDAEYLIKVYDVIDLYVYANNGEIIIDPDFSLRKELGMNTNANRLYRPSYTVMADSSVYLPVVGKVNVVGFTRFELRELLDKEYAKYYEGAYTDITITSRRVTVISGATTQVVPITHENMSVIEVLAISGAFSGEFKADNIRLLRGDLNDPQVELIDLSTIDSMKGAELYVEPGDVLYVEPVKYVFRESTRDIVPFVSLVTSFITMAILIASLSK